MNFVDAPVAPVVVPVVVPVLPVAAPVVVPVAVPPAVVLPGATPVELVSVRKPLVLVAEEGIIELSFEQDVNMEVVSNVILNIKPTHDVCVLRLNTIIVKLIRILFRLFKRVAWTGGGFSYAPIKFGFRFSIKA